MARARLATGIRSWPSWVWAELFGPVRVRPFTMIAAKLTCVPFAVEERLVSRRDGGLSSLPNALMATSKMQVVEMRMDEIFIYEQTCFRFTYGFFGVVPDEAICGAAMTRSVTPSVTGRPS